MVAAISHNNGRLQLQPDLTGTAAARQSVSVASGDRDKQHHLAFGVHGAPGDGVRLKVGTTEGGEELYRGLFNPGFHIAAFTPGAATIHVQFEKPGGWPAQIDDVKFLDDEALELTTPWVQNAVDELRFDQSNDIMTVTHRDFQPCDIVRTAENAFSVEFFDNVDGPYLDENVDDDLTLNPAAVAGNSVNVTAASDLFKDSDVWRHLTIKHGDAWGWGIVRSVTSATVAVVEVKRAFGEATASAAWRLGAWNEAVGYPAAVTYHDGRQVFAGGNTRRLQRRIDASAQPGFNVFTPGAGDDADAWTRDLSSRGGIKHLVSGRQLIVLTTDEERALSGDGDRDPITPSAFRDTSIGRRGASDPTPVALGTVTLFMDRTRRALIELAYDALTEGYNGPDMLLLSQHLTRQAARDRGGVRALAHAENPWQTLFAARDDGALLAFTYLREEQVTGWSRIEAANGAGVVESVTAIPGEPEDELWAVIRYEVDGNTRRYVELQQQPLSLNADPRRAFHVDSGLTLDAPEQAALTPGAATGAGVTFTAGADVFDAGDVGRFIHYAYFETDDAGLPALDDDGFLVWKLAVAEIAAFVSATEVTADIGADFPSTDEIAAGAWHMTVTTVSGLSHLEGETVGVHGDGRQQADRTVSGGAITLEAPASIVHVGRRYGWRWITLPIEGGARQGSSQGRPTNVHRLLARLVRTRGLEAGTVKGSRFPQKFDEAAVHQPDPLFTGDREMAPGGGWQRGVELSLGHDGTYPATVVLLVPRSNVGEAT